MDISIIKNALAKDAKNVAKLLLPNGTEEGKEWKVGDVSGGKGRSLGVHLHGDKAGLWSDFSTGEGGDLIDLWAATRHISIGEAIKEAADHLGIARPSPAFQPRRAYTRPPKPKCAAPQEKVRDYLTEVRNLPAAVLETYKVGEQGDNIVFPFLLPNGELALAKVRKAEDGAKPKPTAANCEPILFGWQAVPLMAREIVITEGEIDAMSWAAYGYPAMSVPFGGGGGAKQQWIENDFERMDRFEKIYIATDMDKPGDEAAAEIAARLGRHRCYRVSMPRKDANACLMDGVAKAEMDAAITGASSLDPEGLRKPTDFVEDVVHLFWPVAGDHIGYQPPYGKLKDRLLFRPGEMTLWSGASGAGKSQVLSDCTVEWIKQGSMICISSLEMRAPSTLKRMCKQVTAHDRPSEAYIKASLDWMSHGLLLYDVIGKASVETLIEVFDYARSKYGCDQFVVDSLMRLGLASDDYSGQEKAVYRLVDWAVSSNIHLHVVAHARKGGPQSGAPETEDIKGAMEIGANAFNILTVWRDRDHEENIRMAELKNDEKLIGELRKKPGVILNVAKQRNGDFEGKIGLWFDTKTYRYRSSSCVSREYVKLSHEVVREYGTGQG
jgi:twinkle protein